MTQENNTELEEFKQELINDGINPEEIFNTDDLTEEAAKDEYIDIAEQIPLEDLTPEEQLIISKCKTRTTLNHDENKQLETIIARYHKPIQTLQPRQTLETYQENQEIIQAEKTFLELLQEQKKADKKIIMNYPLNNGTTQKLTIKIGKVDSSTVTDLQTHLGMFQDFTPDENRIKQKQQNGATLTREEQLILDKMQRKLNEKVLQNQEELMITFLSQVTTIIGEPEDKEYLRQVYQNMEYYYLEKLFEKVSVISGLHVPDADNLFQ